MRAHQGAYALDIGVDKSAAQAVQFGIAQHQRRLAVALEQVAKLRRDEQVNAGSSRAQRQKSLRPAAS